MAVDLANSMEARLAFLDHPLVEFAVTLPPQMRLRGRQDKYILRETMRSLLPEALYRRQKFASMAPPAHRDPVKPQALAALTEQYLTPAAITPAGLLDYPAVAATLRHYQDPTTTRVDRVQLDAVINPLLSVQILHQHFIDQNIPHRVQAQARALGWSSLAQDKATAVAATLP
ncbi:MAG TPA: hypothetical protein IGR64_01445 [Leptolyngbyaceae cyanobacterium M65_K2018_010]|nr:hypothetical protein [Leptolyngbyaceae cyanobacterium M65_K2018_010]